MSVRVGVYVSGWVGVGAGNEDVQEEGREASCSGALPLGGARGTAAAAAAAAAQALLPAEQLCREVSHSSLDSLLMALQAVASALQEEHPGASRHGCCCSLQGCPGLRRHIGVLAACEEEHRAGCKACQLCRAVSTGLGGEEGKAAADDASRSCAALQGASCAKGRAAGGAPGHAEQGQGEGQGCCCSAGYRITGSLTLVDARAGVHAGEL